MKLPRGTSRAFTLPWRIALQRSKPRLLALMTVCALLSGLIGPVAVAPAGAMSSYECVATLPAGTYGNVSVADRQSCIFEEGVTIEGNFKAKNPVDVVTSGATIHGNVTIDGATGVVVVNSSNVIESTSHIYGNVTIKNTDQSGMSPADAGVLYVGGTFLGDGFPDDASPVLHSTLHVHGNLSIKDNSVFDFFAGQLFAELTVDKNVTVERNFVADLDLHVYAMEIGGNLKVNGNTAQAFTSVLCNNVAGNVTIANNFNPGVDPGFGPASAVWAEVQVGTNCADYVHPQIPIGNAAVGGNMTIRNNTSGDGNNSFATLSITHVTVLGDLHVSRNHVNAVELLDDSFLTIEDTYVGGNLTCRMNNIDPIADGYGLDLNEVVGTDKCFGE